MIENITIITISFYTWKVEESSDGNRVANVTEISFLFYGDVNAGGDIRLKETASYSADSLLIPPQLENVTAENFFTTIMEGCNNELRKFALNEIGSNLNAEFLLHHAY